MKRIKYFLPALLIFAFTAMAMTNVDIEQKAKDILNKTSKSYKAKKGLYAEFKIITENKAEKMEPVTESGKIWVKGKKFKIEFDDQIILCNGKISWTYIKGTKELTIENYDPKSTEISPATIFTFYQKDFQSKYDGEYIKNKQKIEKVALNPMDKKRPYFYITLHVNSVKSEIELVEIKFKNGISQKIEMTTQKEDALEDNKFFEYDAEVYPAEFTDDLR